MEAIDTAGIADNTLLIFTSDNGCSPAADVKGLEKKGHFPSGDFRGYKADIWEGGHHIPFIARWPGVAKPGITCGRLVCLTDLMATCAEILAVKLPDDSGEDSFSILPLLRGKDQSNREAIVHHSIKGMFALREAKHKIIFCTGSGGWSGNGADQSSQQLYNMNADIGEQNNLQGTQREEVERMTAKMEKIIADGRSTPGAPQKNDVDVKLHKGE
jgi:arylsulfatase A-like enzyme